MQSPSKFARGAKAIAQAAAIAACLSAGPAAMAAGASAEAQQRYQAEVARCNAGMTQQDTATCLREAGAALQAARQNDLSDNVAANSATQRCSVFVGAEYTECRARIEGPAGNVEAGATITRGSVNSGGILRETITVVPVGTPGSTVVPPAPAQ